MLLLFAVGSCNKYCESRYKKPKNFIPINLENYNDVKTVNDNIVYYYYKEGNSAEVFKKNVKVYGYIFHPYHEEINPFDFVLVPDSSYTRPSTNYGVTYIRVQYFGLDTVEIKKLETIFKTHDITKLCFIDASANYNVEKAGYCTDISSSLRLTGNWDIHFSE